MVKYVMLQVKFGEVVIIIITRVKILLVNNLEA